MQDRALTAEQQHPTTSAPRASEPEDWLLGVAFDAEQARADWIDQGVALFRCGEMFTAVRIPAAVVYAVSGSSDPGYVADHLSALSGPVFVHPRGGQFYALTEPDVSAWWREPDSEALATGTYVGVPALDRIGPGAPLEAYWAVPLRAPSELCSWGAASKLVRAGREALARAETNGGGSGE